MKDDFSPPPDVLITEREASPPMTNTAELIARLTEQVARLTRERDDALATISLLQSQHRKQQEHDTAIIERLLSAGSRLTSLVQRQQGRKG